MSDLQWMALLVAIATLQACSTTSSSGRTQWIAPMPVSNFYSAVDMHTQVALSHNLAPRSGARTSTCETRQAFEARLRVIGGQLSRAVGVLYPQAMKRVSRFDFESAAGREPLSTSSASGTVMVGEGVRLWCLGDEALAFIIARELGHIVAQHHEENTGTSLFFSILGQLMLPISTAYAASYAGSYAVRRSYRPSQRREADSIAIRLMNSAGWDGPEIAAAYARQRLPKPDDEWSRDLRASVTAIERMAEPSVKRKPTAMPPTLAVGAR